MTQISTMKSTIKTFFSINVMTQISTVNSTIKTFFSINVMTQISTAKSTIKMLFRHQCDDTNINSEEYNKDVISASM